MKAVHFVVAITVDSPLPKIGLEGRRIKNNSFYALRERVRVNPNRLLVAKKQRG
jgi:hypothetical protein